MNKRFSILGFVMALALAGLACSITSIGGAPITVTKTEDTNDGACTTTDCSLREAVIEANERAGRNRIVVPEGYYLLTQEADSTAGRELAITDDVIIEGAAQGLTVIDGNGDVSSAGIFGIFGVSAQVSGLTVQNANAPGVPGGAFFNSGGELTLSNVVIFNTTGSVGGAIYNVGTLTLDTVVISSNTALAGGGIYLSNNSSFSVTASHFNGNSAAANGGAIFIGVGSDARVEGTTFASNNSGNSGGAIYNRAILSVRESQLTENSARIGAGLYNGAAAQVEIFDSNLQDNQASGAGGAIMNSQGVVNLNRSSLIGNRASDGAGAWNGSSSFMQLINTTVSANRDTNRGAGLMNSGGQLIVKFSTIFNNAPHSGIYVLYGDTFIENTIVAGNQEGDDTCGSLSEGDVIQSDAVLSGLSFDGNTYVHPLDTGSPALDAGNNLNCPDDDQQLQARPQDGDGDGNSDCDIGAFEFIALQVVPLGLPTGTLTEGEEGDCTYTALVNLFCREGPGSSLYPQLDSLVPGQSAQVVGQSEDGDFVYVVGPNNERVCAVPSSSDFGELAGNCENLPQFTPPPPPPTATNTPVPPTPTETLAADSSISGTVWEDADGGKDIDGGEPRFNGLTIELRAGSCGAGVSQTTTTNASGQYTFSGLQAGTYCVRVLLPPGNWAATVPEFPANQAPTRQVTVAVSELLVGVNFGLQQVVQ
jgi:CSLREA domain-containing protein